MSGSKFAKKHKGYDERRKNAMNSKVLKIIGIVASGVGLLVTLTKDWVDEQTLDAKIDEKLNARSINQDDEEES